MAHYCTNIGLPAGHSWRRSCRTITALQCHTDGALYAHLQLLYVLHPSNVGSLADIKYALRHCHFV
jgi:hypothetical protein